LPLQSGRTAPAPRKTGRVRRRQKWRKYG
jgi:hypothetical protein